MIAMDLVRVCSSTDRDRMVAIARDLRQAGIHAVTIPSAGAIGTWDVEVSADDRDFAGARLASLADR